MNNSKTIELAKELIARPSITPEDAGCQDILIQRLEAIGFYVERLPFADVNNFWARYGSQKPLLTFIGHTDVVPTGPLEKWSSNPFKPEIRDGYLYGRGAADMKSSLAAMVTACEQFIAKNADFNGSIAFLITSDEEGPSIHGTAKVIEVLNKRGDKIDWCIVGEPTCEQRLGDMIKHGRRGTMSGKLKIHGKQGHIAYPQLADNPIHKFANALLELTATVWDQGNEFFQPTSFQFSNIHSGTGAGNVIPGELEAFFNFRFSTEVTAEQLQQRVINILDKNQLRYDIEWALSGKPFITLVGDLVTACQQAIQKITGIIATLSTSGGTSDGRFIASTGSQVVEFGPCNRSIHQIDECVSVADIDKLAIIYQRILENLFL